MQFLLLHLTLFYAYASVQNPIKFNCNSIVQNVNVRAQNQNEAEVQEVGDKQNASDLVDTKKSNASYCYKDQKNDRVGNSTKK